MSESTSQLAANALQGFHDAASYDTHRPSYPAQSVENLLSQLKVAGVEGARLLDLAAGTGKFTELLARRPEKYEVMAVEPHAEMRAQLADKATSHEWHSVTVEEGFADSMGKVPNNWADAVVVAQAFHWFANMKALKEIHRVLAPGAVLGMIWNVEDSHDWRTATEYEQRLNDFFWSHEDGDKRYRDMEWSQVFDEQLKSDPIGIHSADPLFSLPLGEQSDSWEVWLTKEDVWSRIYTHSNIANLKGEKLEVEAHSMIILQRRAADVSQKAKKTVADILASVPENSEGKVAIHGRTHAVWTTAIPGEPLRSGG